MFKRSSCFKLSPGSPTPGLISHPFLIEQESLALQRGEGRLEVTADFHHLIPSTN
jgi:hypothetical protein